MVAKLGDYNAVCDVCGFKMKASKLQKRWDGMMVCSADFELRHPSDLYRFPSGEESTVPWTRPEQTDINVDVTFVDTSDDLPGGHNNGNL